MSLLWLKGEVGPGAGDVAGGQDFRPTDSSTATLDEVEKDLDAARAAFRDVMDKDLAAYRKAMAERK